MRIVIHEYAKGGRSVYETTEHGEMVKEIEGRRKPGQRIRTVVEVMCDDNPAGKKTLAEALERISKLVTGKAA
jgi:hypothetical protein